MKDQLVGDCEETSSYVCRLAASDLSNEYTNESKCKIPMLMPHNVRAIFVVDSDYYLALTTRHEIQRPGDSWFFPYVVLMLCVIFSKMSILSFFMCPLQPARTYLLANPFQWL